jgi:hypothetical protein
VLALTSCKYALTDAGVSVGVGNVIIFFIFSAILTAIVGGLGCLLGLIPIIGKFLKILIGIGIILWWLVLIIGCIVSYGWAVIPLAIIVVIILGCLTGGPGGFIIIFFK